MNKFLDNWATSHRNAKALFTVIGIAIVLVWSLVMKKELDSRTLLRTDQVMATISEITVSTLEGNGRYTGKYSQTNYLVKLDLPNEKYVRFMLQQKPAQKYL